VRGCAAATIVYETTRGGCSANRNYLHEFDFRNATGVNAAMATGAIDGTYTWQVRKLYNALVAYGHQHRRLSGNLGGAGDLQPDGHGALCA
jgi:hypothetical protein